MPDSIFASTKIDWKKFFTLSYDVYLAMIDKYPSGYPDDLPERYRRGYDEFQKTGSFYDTGSLQVPKDCKIFSEETLDVDALLRTEAFDLAKHSKDETEYYIKTGILLAALGRFMEMSFEIQNRDDSSSD